MELEFLLSLRYRERERRGRNLFLESVKARRTRGGFLRRNKVRLYR